jgi:ribosomal protein S24E
MIKTYCENMINIKKLEEQDNTILKRRDLMLVLEHKGEPTPKKESVRELVAKEFKGDPKKTEIIYMFTEGGRAATKVKAFIWKDKIVEKPKEEKKTETKKRKT